MRRGTRKADGCTAIRVNEKGKGNGRVEPGYGGGEERSNGGGLTEVKMRVEGGMCSGERGCVRGEREESNVFTE